ncbi:MAG: preprotein translocase subunit SecG [Deltaproteobacteria bacterium]|jgi:preprotein translocase subunit SecG|nr:preprotein translocase subunit SecG [Deltaproteobacteria bacterium]
MSAFITFIHVIVAIILMISVLLQTGKNSGMGAAFGGTSSSVFGARGPATLISRVTTMAAIIFMVTSLTLSVFAQSAYKRGSVVVADPAPETPVERRVVSEDEFLQVDPTIVTQPATDAPAAGAVSMGADSPATASDPSIGATSTPAGEANQATGAQGDEQPGDEATATPAEAKVTLEKANAAGASPGEKGTESGSVEPADAVAADSSPNAMSAKAVPDTEEASEAGPENQATGQAKP